MNAMLGNNDTDDVVQPADVAARRHATVINNLPWLIKLKLEVYDESLNSTGTSP